MIKAIFWAIKTKLNQIEKEYGDFQFQEKRNENLRKLSEAQVSEAQAMLEMLRKIDQRTPPRKVSKEVREKGAIKGTKGK